jgi:N-methylhydantoinase B
MEIMVIPHDAPAPIQDIVIASSISQPEAPGIFGALPASVQGNYVLRRSDVREQLAAGKIPLSGAEVASDIVDFLQAKDTTVLADFDAHIAWYSGGGGYGDPLARDPELVWRDVRAGLVSPEAARGIYGVVLGADGADEQATVTARDAARAARLASARPASGLVAEVGVT